MKSDKVSVFVILLACLLVVLGDVRFVIGSAGYWVAWCAVIFAGFFCSSRQFGRMISAELFVYMTGFFLILVSFFLSGIINQDEYTIYQGVKVFFIALAFCCIYINARDLAGADIYKISLFCIAIGLFMFLISKFYLREFYVELGDGRQGSQFAYPGVLWKTPVFFVGFVVAGMISGAGNKMLSLLAMLGMV